MTKRIINRQNHNRMMVSLTDHLLVWIEEASADIDFPWMGHNTIVHMAAAALAVLEAVDDLRVSAVEDGELKEADDGGQK